MRQKRKWDKHDIRAAIHRKGTTMAALSEKNGLTNTDVSVAIRRPFPQAEKVIADFLNVEAKKLWPHRFQ